ncbi:hypothetical protein V5O48_019202 [Marasmius crinis-equi]|uniref:Uncharacterized protein n=1 Tax=Marasmius crinis-equi TaxID=585013 RepID=A0ABR3EJ40_9AGAR
MRALARRLEYPMVLKESLRELEVIPGKDRLHSGTGDYQSHSCEEIQDLYSYLSDAQGRLQHFTVHHCQAKSAKGLAHLPDAVGLFPHLREFIFNYESFVWKDEVEQLGLLKDRVLIHWPFLRSIHLGVSQPAMDRQRQMSPAFDQGRAIGLEIDGNEIILKQALALLPLWSQDLHELVDVALFMHVFERADSDKWTHVSPRAVPDSFPTHEYVDVLFTSIPT